MPERLFQARCDELGFVHFKQLQLRNGGEEIAGR